MFRDLGCYLRLRRSWASAKDNPAPAWPQNLFHHRLGAQLQKANLTSQGFRD
jgi:hypothetical protein